METISEAINNLIRQAFDLVGHSWHNNNGIDGLVEFLGTLDHMQKHDEEKLRGMVMKYLPERLNPTENDSVGNDSWVEEYTQIWFSKGDRFWAFYTKMDKPTRLKLLNWLALKQVQREGA